MTAPNITALTSLLGKTSLQNVSTVSTSIVSNDVDSGKLYKINSLIVSNIDGVNTADITVDLARGAASYKLASTISIPADATLVVLSRDIGIYLEEGDSINCIASANDDLQAICSYEIIDDGV